MRSISIKTFSFLSVIIFLLLQSYLFYNFYKESKNNIAELLKSDIQSNINSLQHYINESNIENGIEQIISHLDNTINGNIIFEDMHILTDQNRLLYSTDRDTYPSHLGVDCIPIAQIETVDIFKQQCYTFKIKLYDNLTPYYYTNFIYINKGYIKTIIEQQINKFLLLSSVFLILFFILGWYITNKFLIQPLESLREFTNISSRAPKKFLIKEFETIRRSLHNTFKRLKKEQEALYTLSTKDSLSGLYNRLSLTKNIEQLIEISNKQNKQFAVLFIDLDNFKTINDSIGHDYGDVVLKHVSNILQTSVRENDIVARLGGDEFVILVSDIEGYGVVEDLINRVKERLLKPLSHNNYTSKITASIGVAVYPQDGRDPNELLKSADIAMYKAKELGRDNYCFYTSQLNKDLDEKLLVNQILVESIENSYFELYYQPKVDIKTDKIVSCEALIRLNHPKHGILYPDHFIDVAEKTGLMNNIGNWVIKKAVSQIKIWEHTPLKDIIVSINVSAIQLQNNNFIQDLARMIKDIDPKKLDIELTESIFIYDFDKKLELINQLQDLGVTLSLDDFGTGYSSLSYLKKIPFNTLKIDKVFIDDISNKDGRLFIEMIIKIAKTLNMKVVAEGVENEEQLKNLYKIGCDQYQGFYCSEATTTKKFEELYIKS